MTSSSASGSTWRTLYGSMSGHGRSVPASASGLGASGGLLDEGRPGAQDRDGLVRGRRRIVDAVEQVAEDVPGRRRDRQGEDRPEQPGDRAADDEREHHDARVQLDRVALDLRDEHVVLDLLDDACTARRAAIAASRPAVRARSTAGIAAMIGPMIGSSSRTPAIDRQQDREPPEDGVDGGAQQHQPDERRDADRQTEEDLAAEPLAEHPEDEDADGPHVGPPRGRHRPLGRGARAPAGP